MSDLIDWGTTGQIFVESIAAGVVIVAAFALGARLLAAGRPDGADGATASGSAQGGAAARVALAVVCFAVAAAAVGFGVYFTIDK
jgi:UDP-N-acetylmuramyl pentapeptide phosphotransferase/UDP-N-acetylglucosamine-1-phosphate transferase